MINWYGADVTLVPEEDRRRYNRKSKITFKPGRRGKKGNPSPLMHDSKIYRNQLTDEKYVRPTVGAMLYVTAIAVVFARVVFPHLKGVDVQNSDNAGGAGVLEKIDSFWVAKWQDEEEGRYDGCKRSIGVKRVAKIFVVVPKEAIVLVAWRNKRRVMGTGNYCQCHDIVCHNLQTLSPRNLR